MGCLNCPTGVEPVSAPSNTCYQSGAEACPCEEPVSPCQNPTVICDSRYQYLDESKRITILGADGQCLKSLPKNKVGFVVHDGLGSTERGAAVLTQRPVVPIPYIKRYAKGGDGSILLDECGNPTEDIPPGFDSFIISDPGGAQNRWQGTKNIPGRVWWNGQCFEFIADAAQNDDVLNIIPTDSVHCGVRDLVAIVENTQKVVGGECVTATTTRYAYRNHPVHPYGSVTAFAGEVEPEGWKFCRGQQLSKNEYPDAFAVIGFAFGGSGDLFHMPDYRGRFARGYDPTGTVDPDDDARTALYAGGATGNNLGSYQDDAFQVHGHDGVADFGTDIDVQNLTTTIGPGGNPEFQLTTDATLVIEELAISVCTITDCHDGQSASKTSLHETRPKNLNMNHIIFVGCRTCVP